MLRLDGLPCDNVLLRARERRIELVERGLDMTMAEFRDLTATTRKYAVPVFEWFDATGITIRDGDVRRLREPRTLPARTSPV